MDNLKEFNQAIDNFAKIKVKHGTVQFQKRIAMGALRRLVEKTPVDTGRARANWQVTINTPASGQVGGDFKKTKGKSKDELPPLRPEDRETINRGLANMTVIPPFSTVWICNNVDYIQDLENGTSQQAARGMLAVTIEELNAEFK